MRLFCHQCVRMVYFNPSLKWYPLFSPRLPENFILKTYGETLQPHSRHLSRSRVFFSATILTCILLTYNYHLDRPANRNLDTPTLLHTSTIEPSTSTIPRKLWYKVGPKGLNDQARNWTETCRTQNPTYETQILTDDSDVLYVKNHFADYPDIVRTYIDIPIPILKADLLRYLILFAEGGIWNDLDVTCEGIPIDDWVPEQYRKDASIVVGWEFDVGWGNSFMREFASWTIMAKPRSPHLGMVVDDILEAFRETTRRHNVTVANLNYTMVGDVVDFTGPRRLTGGILKSLEMKLNTTIEVGRELANLSEPRLVGDVLIMPGFSFALSANHYAEGERMGPVLIKHHYAGSWKNDHGGEVV